MEPPDRPKFEGLSDTLIMRLETCPWFLTKHEVESVIRRLRHHSDYQDVIDSFDQPPATDDDEYVSFGVTPAANGEDDEWEVM